MPYLEQHKHTENFLEALLCDHERYMPIVQILDNIVLKLDELSWGEAELIGLELGKQNGSAFCAGIRAGMLEALGADEQVLKDRKFRSLLDFALKLNKDSSAIRQKDIDRVRKAGWGDQTLEDVIGLVAVLKVYSMMANGFGFKGLPAQAFAQMGKATVQQNGYMPIFQSFVEKINAA